MGTAQVLRNKSVILTLVINIVFSNVMLAQTPIQPNSPVRRQALHLSNDIQNAFQSPFEVYLSQLTNLPEMPETIPDSDPVLDDDPFFLRSQSWSSGAQGAFRIQLKDRLTEIQVEDKTLTLHLPLKPFFDDGRYIYLSAPAEIFNVKQGGQNTEQGFFILDNRDLLGASRTGRRVPVFFFPLPGMEWDHRTSAYDSPNSPHLVVVSGAGLALPIETKEMDSVVQAERLNLTLAKGLGHQLRAKKALLQSKQALENPSNQSLQAAVESMKRNMTSTFGDFEALPPPKSTAGFGVIFNAWKMVELPTHEKINKTSLFDFLLPRAHASDEDIIAASNRSLLSRFRRVSFILAASFIGAIVIRKFIYAERFATPETLALRSRIKQSRRLTETIRLRTQLEKAEFRSNLDVFAATLTVFSTVSGVTSARMIEHFLDQYWPRFSSRNSLMRRFLERTFLRSAKTATGIVVDWNAVVRGGGVIGGLDTACVWAQLKWVSKWVAEELALFVPAVESRVAEAYDSSTFSAAVVSTQIGNEVARNGFGYAAGGGSSYVISQQSRIIFQTEAHVEEQIRNMHFPPGMSSSEKERLKASERDRLTRELVEAGKKRVGLAGKEKFLFDTASILAGLRDLLGYTQAPDPFGKSVASERPGIMFSAAKAAVRLAETLAVDAPKHSSVVGALDILRMTVRRLSLFKSIIDNPISLNVENPQALMDLLSQVGQTRREISALMGSGPISPSLAAVPSEWLRNYSGTAAVAAAHLFRRALTGILSGDEIVLDGIRGATRNAFLEEAQSSAREALLVRHMPELSVDLIETTDLSKRYPFEYNVLVEEKLIEFTQDALSRSVKPHTESDGFFTRWQKNRAARRANADYFRDFGKEFLPGVASATETEAWMKAFSGHLQTAFDLYIDYGGDKALKESVQKAATTATHHRLHEAGVAEYRATMGPLEGAIFEASLYSVQEASAYLQQTSLGHKLSALSPSQPGRLQWLRQKPLLRSNAKGAQLLTRAVRAIEALVSHVSYGPGLKNWFYRNFPMGYDLTQGLNRTFWLMPSLITVSYFWNQVVWGADIALSQWIFFGLTMWTIYAPGDLVDRAFTYQGIRPMGKLSSTVLLALVYTWATFTGSIPMQIFGADAERIWKSIVTFGYHTPLEFIKTQTEAAVGLCTGLIRSL